MDKNRFVISECPRCHALLIADLRYKSKTCHNCNARIQIDSLRVIDTAKNSREARSLVSKAKERRGG